MRIINVVEIINGEFNGIESFVIFEEQLSEDVVNAAEHYFKILILSQNGREEDLDIYIENGYYESKNLDYKVYLSWSNIN